MSWNANESTITPLHEACLSGNIKIVKTLLEYGASVHSKDYEGDTPLHMACGSGNLEVVQTLLQHNADVHVMNEIWETPLHAALHIRY